MRSDTFLTFSPALGHDLETRRYAADGTSRPAAQPILAFPSMNGRVWDWENFGMVESIRGEIESGRVTLYVTDGIDWQSWTAAEKAPLERVARHADYDRYLVEEILGPFLAALLFLFALLFAMQALRGIDVFLGDVHVMRHGAAREYDEGLAAAAMKDDPVVFRICLNQGGASAWMWTSDLSHGYVDINAHYRS